MALEHDGAARGLVAAARLHADVAVLDYVQAPDAVLATNLVQIGQHFGRGHVLAIDGNDVALAVSQLDVGRRIRRRLRRTGPTPHVLFVLGPGIFQHTALVGDMQQVGVHRIGRLFLAVAFDRDVMVRGVIHQLLA